MGTTVLPPWPEVWYDQVQPSLEGPGLHGPGMALALLILVSNESLQYLWALHFPVLF